MPSLPVQLPTRDPTDLTVEEIIELRSTHHLLHLIFYRNRNQHRSSIWWTKFSAFRKELRQLVEEINTANGHAATSSAKAPFTTMAVAASPASTPATSTQPLGKTAKRKAKLAQKLTESSASPQTRTSSSALTPAQRKVAQAAHTAELREQATLRYQSRLAHWTNLVPAWYRAFSQLIASSRFSAMGLVLLAALARVCKTVGIIDVYERLAQQEEERVQDEIRRVLLDWGKGEGRELLEEVRGEDLGEVVGRDNDMGHVVVGEEVLRREEDDMSIDDDPAGLYSRPTAASMQSLRSEAAGSATPDARRLKSKSSTPILESAMNRSVSSLRASREHTPSSTSSTERRKYTIAPAGAQEVKQAKYGKPVRPESSNVSTNNPALPSKKKRKKGNAIDDLFSGIA